MIHEEIPPALAGERLDRVVALVADASRSDAAALVAAGGVAVDGDKQTAPYTILAIGDSQTMATALEIPGGVLASLPEGARGTVAAKEEVRITALRPVPTPRYAQPAVTPTPTR